jgi:nucleotide-binding universal stress UspA family protein
MTSYRDRVPASDAGTRLQPAFRRVLVCVEDASQVEQAVQLARRSSVPGMTEARVLHLRLRESIGGRRFPLETRSAASYVLEAAVFELRMADLGASGHMCAAPFDQAADAIVAEAADWGADLIVLGAPRRGELMTRLFGSVTLRVLQRAPCPVLVASATGQDVAHRDEELHAGHRS